MSPWGYLLFTGWATLMALLVRGWWLAGLVLVFALSRGEGGRR